MKFIFHVSSIRGRRIHGVHMDSPRRHKDTKIHEESKKYPFKVADSLIYCWK
jgi:hypothetical protein